MSSRKEMPDCPRPTGDALLKKEYNVRDRIIEGKPPKFWNDAPLTYDEAWKLKQKVAGERKSTTVRVEHIGKFKGAPPAVASFHVSGGVVTGVPPGVPDPMAQAQRNAQAAARMAAHNANARQTVPVTQPAPAQVPGTPLDTALLTPEQQAAEAELQDLLGGDSDDLDDLIDAAQDSDAPL